MVEQSEHRERIPNYHELLRVQCLCWAQGNSYHDRMTDECTPDFSCCEPSLQTPEDDRWAYYHSHYGRKQ